MHIDEYRELEMLREKIAVLHSNHAVTVVALERIAAQDTHNPVQEAKRALEAIREPFDVD